MPDPKPPLLRAVQDAEKSFLSGRRNREQDLESAVRIFLEILRGFEELDFSGPCVTVFGSARFSDGHPYYETAKELGQRLAEEMLVKYSSAFVVMPGGFGTLDEAFEVVTLVQTKKLESFPIVAMGGSFWNELREFVTDTMIAAGTISEADLDVMQLADDVETAIKIIRQSGNSR